MSKLPIWQAYQTDLEKQGLKKHPAPKAVSLSDGVLANEGKPDTELESLIEDQEKDNKADCKNLSRRKQV